MREAVVISMPIASSYANSIIVTNNMLLDAMVDDFSCVMVNRISIIVTNDMRLDAKLDDLSGVMVNNWISETYSNPTLNQPLTGSVDTPTPDSIADSTTVATQVFPRWNGNFPTAHWIHTHGDLMLKRVFDELPQKLDYSVFCSPACTQGCSCISELRKVAGGIFSAQNAAESIEALRVLYQFIQCDVCGQLVNQPIRPVRTRVSTAYLRCLDCLEKKPIDPASSNWQECRAMRRVADWMRIFELQALPSPPPEQALIADCANNKI